MNSQFSRFVVVGIFNTLLGYAIIFGAMYLLRMSPVASNVSGYSIGLLSSFILNRTFTFRSIGKRSAELARFLAVFAIAVGANLATLYVLVNLFFFHAGFSQVLAGIVYVIISYIMNKNIVFRQKNDGLSVRI